MQSATVSPLRNIRLKNQWHHQRMIDRYFLFSVSKKEEKNKFYTTNIMHLNPPNRRRLLKPGTDKSSLLSKEVLNIVFGQAHTHTHNPLTVQSLSSKYKITFGNSWLLSSQHEHKATKKGKLSWDTLVHFQKRLDNYPGTHSYTSRSSYKIILGHTRTFPETVRKLSSDTLVLLQRRLENYPGTHSYSSRNG